MTVGKSYVLNLSDVLDTGCCVAYRCLLARLRVLFVYNQISNLSSCEVSPRHKDTRELHGSFE